MVLARLLSPQDFGLEGMMVVVTGRFKIATVQRLEVTHEQTSALF
jgi:Polysaccharide biosynthesis protein